MLDFKNYCPYADPELINGEPSEIKEYSEQEELFNDSILDAFYDQGGYMRKCDYCGEYYPFFPYGVLRNNCRKEECLAKDKSRQKRDAREIRKNVKRMEAEEKAREEQRVQKQIERDEQKRQYQEYLKFNQVEDIRLFGYIYLMISANGLYKIGRAKNVQARLTSLNREIPIKTELVHQIASNNYLKAELFMHVKFADKCVKYEWFDLSQEQVDWIKSLGDFQIDELVSIEIIAPRND